MLQANGLSGHLALQWKELRDSIWIRENGTGDPGKLHEMTPYWLNGIVPLFYLLRNVAMDRGTWHVLGSGHEARKHTSMVHELQRQLEEYVGEILARQQEGRFTRELVADSY